jgi:hypothetical protein
MRSSLQGIVAGAKAPQSMREAALACLSSKVGSVPELDEAGLAHLLPGCGRAEWMVRNVIDYEVAAREDDLAAGVVNAQTTLIQYGSIAPALDLAAGAALGAREVRRGRRV